MALYMVLYLGSHPDSDNDDCWYGFDFDSKEEAIKAFLAPVEDRTHCPARDVAYVEIDGLEDSELAQLKINRVRANPTFKKSSRSDDDDWKREAAQQAGMAFGCEGYNDYYG